MKLFLFLLLCVVSLNTNAGWTDLNTGIDDDLTGVVFWGNNGVVSGNKGIYYTTTGGVGPSAWTHFTIDGNPTDSLTYSCTRFKHAYGHSTNLNYVFACGVDTCSNRAIIMQFYIPTQTYQILYTGNINSKLNNISYSTQTNKYYAVGDSGLIVNFKLNTLGTNELVVDNIDYLSISFYQSKFSIGSNDFHVFGTNNISGLSITSNTMMGKTFNDYWRVDEYFGYAVGDKVYQVNYTTGTITESSNYGFGSLNAKSVFRRSSYYFVGTDHGIFRFTSLNAIEYQPTSSNFDITDFWSQSSLYPIYACGKNGVLLSTSDNGGLPIPYLTVEEQGGCVGQNLSVTGTFGSSQYCQWYINGVYTSGSCSNLYISAPPIGTYEVELIGINSSGTDTASTIFHVVQPPNNNQDLTILDSIICKNSPVEIEITPSQMGVFYSIYNISSWLNYGNSPEGNDTSLTFITNPINQTGQYLVKAKSSIANCQVSLLDTINIVVEHTQAAIHVGSLNAKTDEDVYFYQNCTDAANFLWEFPTGSSLSSSTDPDVINSFSQIGNQTIKLKCWSENECYDSVQINSPFIYNPSLVQDSCWVNLNSGDDPLWTGHFYYEISDMIDVKDGYIITGTYHDHAFATQIGDSLILNNFGAFLCKYSYDGVYKWNIHAPGAGAVYGGHGSLDKYSFHSVCQDDSGNIYTCGYFFDYYIDNKGDTINTYSSFGVGGLSHIIKLDSLGRTIWHMNTDELWPQEINVDHNGDLLVTSLRRDDYDSNFIIKLNGAVTDTILSSFDASHGLTKFSSDGALIWDIPIEMNYVNVSNIIKVEFDSQSNIYLAANYELSAVIHSLGVTDNVNNSGLATYGSKFLLSKINQYGELLWLTRSYTIGRAGTAYVYDITSDLDGNTYLSGRNSCEYPTNKHYFESTNGDSVFTNGGAFYTFKINSDGICLWTQASFHSKYGYGWVNFLKDDTLYVVGSLSTGTSDFISDVNFYNPDSSILDLQICLSDNFIAVFDTSGFLYRTIKNGNNYAVIGQHSYTGFFINDENKFYLNRTNTGFATTPYPNIYFEFQDTITYINGIDSWVSSFYEDCGHILRPRYYDVNDYSICLGESFTFPNGTTIYNITDNIIDTTIFQANWFADSLIVSNVIVNNIDTNLTLSGFTLLSNHLMDSTTAYQWVNCGNNYEVIFDETTQSYLPNIDGTYAVIINQNGCIDTSECKLVYGLLNEELGETPEIFPVPTSSLVYVYLNSMQPVSMINVYNEFGEKIYSQNPTQPKTEILLPNVSGIYFIQVIYSNGTIYNKKVIKM